MNQLKILFAIGRLSVGGAEKLLVHQLRAINQERFETHLVTLFPEKGDSFSSLVKLPAERWRKINFRSAFDPFSWWRLISYFRRHRFDAVVTSLFSANWLARLAAILCRVPVIISYEHNLYPNKNRWQILIDRWLSRWTDKILVDAEAVSKFTAQQENISLEKFLTLHIPPLLENRRPQESVAVRRQLGLPDDVRVILTVSRLVPEKGHNYLINAAQKVLVDLPNIYFLLVGWGPLHEDLKALAKNLHLDNRVLLPGKMDIQDVLPLADIYVDPALNVDIGIALMEAMRAKKAIVATAVGEMPVFIKDGISGFLVQPGDAAALAERISVLLKDDGLRAKFSKAASARVKNFSLESYMRQFEDLIEQFVSKRSNLPSRNT